MALGKGFNFPLGVVFAGIDKLTTPLQRMESRLSAFGSSATKLGKKMTAGLTVPLAAVGALSVRSAAQFEQGMNRVRALKGATDEQMVALDKRAQELGSTTSFTARQVADAMGFLAQAGFSLDEIAEGTPAVLQLAAAGSLDLARSAEITAMAMSGYGLEVADLQRIVDVMAVGQKEALTDVEQLGTAFNKAGALAAGMNQRLEVTAAVLAQLATGGFQAELGGTALKGFFAKLARIRDDNALLGNLGALGITPEMLLDSDGRVRDLIEIFDLLREKMPASEALRIFGTEVGPGITALLNQPADALALMVAKMDEAQGTGKRMADDMMRGLVGETLRLTSAFEGLLIKLARSGMLEAMTGLTEEATALLTRMNEASPATLKFATKVGLVAAAVGPVAFTFGQLTVGIGGLVKVLGFAKPLLTWVGAHMLTKLVPATWSLNAAMAANPIGATVLAIGGLITAGTLLVRNWEKVKIFFKDFWDFMQLAAAEFFEWYAGKLGRVGEVLFGFDELREIGDSPDEIRARYHARKAREAAAADVARSEHLSLQQQDVTIRLPNMPAGATVQTSGDGIVGIEVGRLMGAGG